MKITVQLGERSYPIYLKRGLLQRAGKLLDLNRKVLIVTDEGVPASYSETVRAQCRDGIVVTLPAGEETKSFSSLSKLCSIMLDHTFSRKDCVVAVGGGVVGDLAGFAAAVYMRGIDFYNIPTTTLSQIDSSIGGKTAVNLNGVKNIVGAFHQPKAVLVDPDTLRSLPRRHYINGLMEALKAGLIADKDLFAIFARGEYDDDLEEILYRSLEMKRKVVEEDETEQGLRKILNFGHTIGHGIESAGDLERLYHGESIALGMLPMITDPLLRRQTEEIIAAMGVDPHTEYDKEKAFAALCKDKKASDGMVTIVLVDKPGEARLEKVSLQSLREMM